MDIFDTTSLLPFTSRQQAVLTGTLLGDSFIQHTSSHAGTCRLRFYHCIQQAEYCKWKREVFINFCNKTKPPYVSQRHNNKGSFAALVAYTEYRKEFKPIHTMWYSKNIHQKWSKRVPATIKNLLKDPLGLAVWYLDDGTYRTDCESARLATQGFTFQENELLQQVLFYNFQIVSCIETTKRSSSKPQYGLAILSKTGGFRKLRETIYDIVKTEIPTMIYKLERTL
jgi:hypothetical protein